MFSTFCGLATILPGDLKDVASKYFKEAGKHEKSSSKSTTPNCGFKWQPWVSMRCSDNG